MSDKEYLKIMEKAAKCKLKNSDNDNAQIRGMKDALKDSDNL